MSERIHDCTCGHADYAHDRNGKCTVGQRFAAVPVCPCEQLDCPNVHAGHKFTNEVVPDLCDTCGKTQR